MGRLKKTAIPPADTPPGAESPLPPETTAPPVRRRRRRRTTIPTVDTFSETSTLLSAVLRNRGSQGATSDMLHHVIAWATRVREEGEELRAPGPGPGRGRRKPPIPAERLALHEMNRALLEGVLNGTLTLQVQDDGSLLFLHAEAAKAASAASLIPLEEPLADVLGI